MIFQIFVHPKKVSIELKISSLMSLIMFNLFTRFFKYSNFIELQFFFVNYSTENHSIFPGGSMGKIIGRSMPNILLFILYYEG